MPRRLAPAALAVALLACAAPAHAQSTRLVRQPSVSARDIAFAYAGDVWIVPRAGGEAHRVTSLPGVESDPHLSPDGRMLAFTGEYGGNPDVYVVPAEGGEPRRLTWHPGPDQARGWTPDGRRVVFASGRTSAPIQFPRLWSVSVEGGAPEPLPMPRAAAGDYAPDGARIAYQPVEPWEQEMRSYRGGQNRPVWVMDLKTYDVETLPWKDSRDSQPVWLGRTIYFLSDRDWATNVWAYDVDAKNLRQVTHYADYDVKSLGAGGGAVVYEQAGYIHLLDPASGQDQQVDIRVRGDFPWAMPRWAEVGKALENPSLSPTGVRALFEARGDVVTVPVDKDKGDARDLTPSSSGAHDHAPVWSPDGKRIAWFSDASGEYRLMIGDQDGAEKPREIALDHPTFYYTPAWSPDGKKLLYTDAGLNLWVMDVATGKAVRADGDAFAPPERTIDPVWSPDSRFVAYAKRLNTQFHAIFVYSLDDGKARQLTDGLSDAVKPAWDRNGKYLYFLASTDYGLNSGWLDMSSYDRPVQRGIYLAVLAADQPSPILPEHGDEGAAAAAPAADTAAKAAPKKPATAPAPAAPARVRIDFDGFMQRVVALPVPTRDYAGLVAGAEGQIFYVERIPNRADVLHRFDLKTKKPVDLVPAIAETGEGAQFSVSGDGKKLLFQAGTDTGMPTGAWAVVDAGGAPPKPGDGALQTAALKVRIDPRAEWKQIFREAWRIERDYLYVPNMNGADWDAVWRMYSPMVDDVRHRADLTYLLDVMQGELALAHTFVGGGDLPKVDAPPVGLLGADLEAADGRYRISRIYSGENWNPQLQAPLSAPGVNVHVGDYILAVNGVELRAPTEPYSAFEGTAGKQTILRVNDRPTLEGSRLVTVVPVPSEAALRQRAWIEDNRRKVDQLSGGKLAYVWLPNTAGGGYTNFNRYYFAQQDRQGAVIDERFNGGGSAADYIIDVLSRKLHGYFNNPVGQRTSWTSPGAGIWGPKVMIVNEMAGSGGDMLPYMFQQMKIGPLVGMKTWGGLVGIWDAPRLADGGSITAPRGGFYNLKGEWDVENIGVSPDIEVEQTPKDVIAGKDPQLERAVQEALRLLAQNPVKLLPEPKPPVRPKRPVATKATNQ
ncbi:MAG TPA: PDZ domain-containing protein [Longimicrobiales bacterium]|nr:PDZ domain-containing protein [Longimicrobiales bacterium]